MTSPCFAKPPPENGERHTLSAESEIRLEVPSNVSITLTLLSGSAEIFGAEMALAADLTPFADLARSTATAATAAAALSGAAMVSKQSYLISGHCKFAVFTWHGCTLDVDVEHGKSLDISYTSSETNANVAFVNTHAQLEVLRDEALQALLQRQPTAPLPDLDKSRDVIDGDGPRVLICGPPDSGKTTLARILIAYAVKLGRTPILVDLDPSLNLLSVPGTLTASVITPDSISVTSYAGAGNTIATGTSPLVLWYGSTSVPAQPDLYQAQLTHLGNLVDARARVDVDTQSSGLIINSCGWIEEGGYKLLLHAITAFRVNVLLIMGHDRLYSMLQSHFKTKVTEENSHSRTLSPKVIKLPRSGGVVSRDDTFRRVTRSLCIKRYFHGDLLPSPLLNTANASPLTLVHQYTPVLLELHFSQIRLYKLSMVSLTASMLPIAAKQATDPVQLNTISTLSPSLTHALLAVCHPNAVQAFDRSGNASDLYSSGVAGFIAVERVNIDKDTFSALSPCSGSLPSPVLILGDVSWME